MINNLPEWAVFWQLCCNNAGVRVCAVPLLSACGAVGKCSLNFVREKKKPKWACLFTALGGCASLKKVGIWIKVCQVR